MYVLSIFRLVFILDPDARSFSLDDPFYHQRLKCGLVVNILKNGQWCGLNHMSVPEQDCCPQKNLLSLPLEDSFERLVNEIYLCCHYLARGALSCRKSNLVFF